MNAQMTVIFVHTDVWEGGFAHKNMNNDVFKICSFREHMLPDYSWRVKDTTKDAKLNTGKVAEVTEEVTEIGK